MGNAAIASVGLGANLFGGLFSAFGKEKAGQSQAELYNYQAGVAQVNQQIAKQNETYALDSGEVQARQYGISAAQKLGAIRAGQGASGFDVGMGSPKDVQSGQQKTTAMDLNQIRTNAARVAYGYAVQGTQAEAQEGLYKTAAKTSVEAGNIGAVGSLISTAGGVSDKWLQAKQYGISLGGGA